MISILATLFLLGSCGVPLDSDDDFVEAVGLIDDEFYKNLSTGPLASATGAVDSIVTSSDGSFLYLGGRLTLAGGDVSWIKISSQGIVDATFLNSQPNDSIFSLARDFKGDVWAAGPFLSFGSAFPKGIFLWETGFDKLVSTVTTNLGTGFKFQGGAAQLKSLAISPSNDIYVGGDFDELGSNTVKGFAKISDLGVPDVSFNTYFTTGVSGGSVETLKVLGDGRIALGGSFTLLNGTTRGRMAVIGRSGIENTEFKNNLESGFNGNVAAFCEDSNGKIWVGGTFDRYKGQLKGPLVVLSSSGVWDEELPAGISADNNFQGSIYDFALQPNGKIVVGGNLTRVKGVAFTGAGVVRFDTTTGELDKMFSQKLAAGFVGGSVRSLVLDRTGKIYAVGDFTQFQGKTVPGIVKIK
jgi:hypothetical protein